MEIAAPPKLFLVLLLVRLHCLEEPGHHNILAGGNKAIHFADCCGGSLEAFGRLAWCGRQGEQCLAAMVFERAKSEAITQLGERPSESRVELARRNQTLGVRLQGKYHTLKRSVDSGRGVERPVGEFHELINCRLQREVPLVGRTNKDPLPTNIEEFQLSADVANGRRGPFRLVMVRQVVGHRIRHSDWSKIHRIWAGHC